MHRRGSEYGVRPFPIIALLLITVPGWASDIAKEADEHSDIDLSVQLDAGEQSGRARGLVRIHASREVVWSLLTSCPEVLSILPGLQSCEVLSSAPDHSWQLIRHVMNYSWYIPTVTYQMRASYDRPAKIEITRESGDLRNLHCVWNLQADGEYTIASYVVELSPGFWVPQWMVRAALRRDLPKTLRSLRARAEAVQSTAH
jgi:Polyketide cyclase / dehydrase and lipid transport